MKALSGRIPALFALFALFASGAAAAPPKKTAPAPPYQSAADAAVRSGFFPVRNSGGALFVAGRSTLRLVPDKPFCFVDNVKVYQCFPTRRSAGRLLLSRLDAQKTVLPLSPRRTGVFRHRVRTIIIDPGHGGRDRGAAGRWLIEKMATLMLANQLKSFMSRLGYDVHLTRKGDYFLPLAERCRIQRRHRSDIFVSIHVNAATNRGLYGIETFALTPAGAASTSGGPPSNKFYSGNRLDANNLLLAYLIQKALLRRTGAFDRGVKRARFAVLRDIDAPGVLVEVGFASNLREERLLITYSYNDKIIRGIAEGIIAYRNAVEGR